MERMEHRRTELARRAARDQLDNIVATSPDAIVCANAQGLITSWNGAAEQIFGHAAAEAVGRSLEIIIPSAFRVGHEHGMRRVVEGGRARIIGKTAKLSALKRDGSQIPVELSLSRWTEGGEPQFGAIIRDVTQRTETEDRLRHAADFDHLTGLPNRRSLMRRIRAACATETRASVLIAGVDRFSEVNLTLGHAFGDRALRLVADRLSSAAPPDCLLGRLGGNEFIMFMPGVNDPIAASAVARSMQAAIDKPAEIDDQTIHMTASVGVAIRDDLVGVAEDFVGDAHLALSHAKAQGRRLVRFFTPGLRSAVSSRVSIGAQLRRGWAGAKFELYFQPQVSLRDRSPTGAEALIRWNHPERGVLAPAAFLEVLEAGSLAAPVGEWILRSACEIAAQWRRAAFPNFRVGVNLFAAQFWTSDLVATISSALAGAGLPSEALELEITENIILDQGPHVLPQLRELRGMGVEIAFDDFGTGFASLSALKDYPVTRLKIDRQFVSGTSVTRRDRAVVEAVARIGRAFDLEVIAEGVETEEQPALMRSLGCAEGQGYLFGRPMPAGEFARTFCAPRIEAAEGRRSASIRPNNLDTRLDRF